MTLDKLMKRLIDGDKSAFEEIYSQTRKPVYYIALSIVRDRALAEDVMQSTYLNVLRNSSKYCVGSNAGAWIAKIARNEALNLQKSRSRNDYVDENENLPLFGSSQTDDYGLLVDMARRTLPSDDFSILMLVTACGYKRREIAEMLDMPIATVTWKYNNAIAKLRQMLSKGE